MTGKYQLRQSD